MSEIYSKNNAFHKFGCIKISLPFLIPLICFFVVYFYWLRDQSIMLNNYKFKYLEYTKCAYGTELYRNDSFVFTGDTWCFERCASHMECKFATQTYEEISNMRLSRCILYSSCKTKELVTTSIDIPFSVEKEILNQYKKLK